MRTILFMMVVDIEGKKHRNSLLDHLKRDSQGHNSDLDDVFDFDVFDFSEDDDD